MGVKMNVGTVGNYLTKMNSHLLNIPWKCNQVEQQITEFSQDGSLDGKAYSNHKGYMEQLHMPVMTGIKNLCSEMTEANNKYRECLNAHFPGISEVDEDRWREEFERLKQQYEQANSMMNYMMEMMRQSLMMGSPNRGIVVENYTYMARSYQEELDMLYEALELYRDRIERVGLMLAASGDIYTGVEMMGSALREAINTISRVQYNAAGNQYSYAALDLSSITNLDSTWKNLQIAKEVRKILGDDLLSPEEFSKMDSFEQQEYAEKLYEKLNPLMPGITSKLGEGEVHIPIAAGLALYGGVSTSLDILNTGSTVGIDLAKNENAGILDSWSVKVGNMEAKVGRTELGVKFVYELSEKSTAYSEYAFNKDEGMARVEKGATTKVLQDGSVTTKVGLEIYTSTDTWSEVQLDNYETGDVLKPREVIELPPIFMPIPGSMPVPVI